MVLKLPSSCILFFLLKDQFWKQNLVRTGVGRRQFHCLLVFSTDMLSNIFYLVNRGRLPSTLLTGVGKREADPKEQAVLSATSKREKHSLRDQIGVACLHNWLKFPRLNSFEFLKRVHLSKSCFGSQISCSPTPLVLTSPHQCLTNRNHKL